MKKVCRANRPALLLQASPWVPYSSTFWPQQHVANLLNWNEYCNFPPADNQILVQGHPGHAINSSGGEYLSVVIMRIRLTHQLKSDQELNLQLSHWLLKLAKHGTVADTSEALQRVGFSSFWLLLSRARAIREFPPCIWPQCARSFFEQCFPVLPSSLF